MQIIKDVFENNDRLTIYSQDFSLLATTLYGKKSPYHVGIPRKKEDNHDYNNKEKSVISNLSVQHKKIAFNKHEHHKKHNNNNNTQNSISNNNLASNTNELGENDAHYKKNKHSKSSSILLLIKPR